MRQLIEIEWGWRDKWNDIQTNNQKNKKQRKKPTAAAKYMWMELSVSFHFESARWSTVIAWKYDYFIPYLCCRLCGGMSKKEKFPVSNVWIRMNQFDYCVCGAYKWTNNTIFDSFSMYNNYIEISQSSFCSLDRCDRYTVCRSDSIQFNLISYRSLSIFAHNNNLLIFIKLKIITTIIIINSTKKPQINNDQIGSENVPFQWLYI